jgi:hypothetical protein
MVECNLLIVRIKTTYCRFGEKSVVEFVQPTLHETLWSKNPGSQADAKTTMYKNQ